MNKAISFILKEAVINDRQGARIDFTKVVLSKGELLASFYYTSAMPDQYSIAH